MAVVVKGNKVLLLNGNIGPATLLIRDGKFAEIQERLDIPTPDDCIQVVEAGDLLVTPGVVDSHVHVNEPGRTAWEGFSSATKAAAAGGVTTIVDMPLNSLPSTTSLDALKVKLEAAAATKRYVDVAFWGGVVPGNKDSLKPMVNVGVCGFKCFMIHSGVDEFQHVNTQEIKKALYELKGTGVPLLFHAEADGCAETISSGPQDGNAREYKTFLNSRPSSMELDAIRTVINLCNETRVPCHIVHLATAGALDIIRKAKGDKIPLTVETTHHYLTLDADSVPDGATEYKCCPPIRDKSNQTSLWEAVFDGDIDMVISDHSPCTEDLKAMDTGDFNKAWGGIAGVQFGLSLFWTGVRQRGGTYQQVVTCLCENTARLCGLEQQKGAIRVGLDADLVIWDPDAKFKITRENVYHKNKLTPYLNKEYYGVVHKTMVRGDVVYDNGEFIQEPRGKLLLKNK